MIIEAKIEDNKPFSKKYLVICPIITNSGFWEKMWLSSVFFILKTAEFQSGDEVIIEIKKKVVTN